MRTAPSFLGLVGIAHLFFSTKYTLAAVHHSFDTPTTDDPATLRDQKRRQRQLDKQKHKRKNKHDALSNLKPAEIATKSDEELMQLYQKQKDAETERVDELYGNVLNELKKKDISEKERQMLVKRRKIMEERRARMEREREKNSKIYMDRMRDRARHMHRRREEL